MPCIVAAWVGPVVESQNSGIFCLSEHDLGSSSSSFGFLRATTREVVLRFPKEPENLGSDSSDEESSLSDWAS